MDKHLEGDLICDYAEGALDAAARAAVDAHMRTCAECRREVEAARGYFMEMSGLEPVKAPANFLANVRARLPQPSPWKRALMGFMRPWRAIPLQIAVLTVLGITVITAYLYQNGGVVSETSRAPVAGYEAIPPAPSPKPAVPAPAPQALPNADADAESEVRSEEPAPAAKTHALRKELRPAKKSLRSSGDAQPEAFAEDAQPAPGPAPKMASRPPAVGRSSGGNRAVSPQAKGSSVRRQANSPVIEAERIEESAIPAQASKSKPSEPKSSAPGKLKEVEVTGWLDNPSAVYILDGSGEQENLGEIVSHGDGSQSERLAAGGNRDAVEPEKKKTEAVQDAMKDAAPGSSIASAPSPASASVEGKAEGAQARKEIPLPTRMFEDGPDEGDSGAKGADTGPGFTLRLRAAKDTAAVLAGLKAMGAEVVSPPRKQDPGYVLRLPPSAFGGIGPYLERYGKVERRGRLSSAHLETPAHVRLRMILPGK